MTKISVLFPMAGLGSRFGYTFKPFLLATDETFIELARKPFDQLKKHGFQPVYYFIVRKSQEEEFQVSQRLRKLFPYELIHCLTIDDTDGPLQTVQAAIRDYHLKGAAFICDCDHAINIEPLIQKLPIAQSYEVLIPTWEITEEDYPHWGKVKVDDDSGAILDFCEKSSMEGTLKGLIGCYLFRDIHNLLDYPDYENISDVLRCMLSSEEPMLAVPIAQADFFGTPAALEKYRFKRAQQYTLFIDIDGTLIHQTERTILPETASKIDQWKTRGHRIILTTARRQKHMKEVTDLLTQNKIYYDDIIHELPSGPRYVINDRKPYIPYYCMAEGIVLERNKGIADVVIPAAAAVPSIINKMPGASFATVYLVERDGVKFVRKYIAKTPELMIHAETLQRQCDDLRRLYFYKKGICPKILNEYNSPSEYYYDMEYLEGYQKLSIYQYEAVLPTIMSDLKEHVYCYRKANYSSKWVQDYLDEKVLPKFKIIGDSHPGLQSLLEQKQIWINHQPYTSLQSYLEKIDQSLYTPEYTCPIHGDLTLENILYHPYTKEYKLIDPSGSRYMDAPEMDTARIFQSLVGDYASWEGTVDLVQIIGKNQFIIPTPYLKDKFPVLCNLYSTNTYRKGIFYMATYFIRMAPYMLRKSYQQALFTLLLAIHHLHTLS